MTKLLTEEDESSTESWVIFCRELASRMTVCLGRFTHRKKRRKEESDIDVCVKLHTPDYDTLMDIKEDLEQSSVVSPYSRRPPSADTRQREAAGDKLTAMLQQQEDALAPPNASGSYRYFPVKLHQLYHRLIGKAVQ